MLIKKLKKFKKRYGHCNVPQKYEDRWLAQHVAITRVAYNKNRLKQSQIDKLNAIGFIWDVSIYKYNTFIAMLVEFKQINGHCNVPRTYHDKWFGRKIGTIRQAYKKGSLPFWVIDQLNEIGFQWEMFSNLNELFLVRLEAFKLEYGHCNVPYNYHERLFSIKVNTTRKCYKKGTLPQWYIDKLNEMGFKWKLRN
jgi:hypothetical protein